MSNTQKGEIHHIGETVTFPSGFSKRLCVISYQDGEYENFLAIDFLKEKGDILNGCRIGQTVTISYNLRSNENPKKAGMWFTSASAWKLESDEQPAQERAHKQDGHPLPQQPAQAETMPEGDDIPF